MNRGLVLSVAVRVALAATLLGSPAPGIGAEVPAKKDEKASAGSILPRIPAIDPGAELSGKALVTALRQGGFVLYVRHTETGEVTETCEKTNLTARGREMAVDIGVAIKKLQIPLGKAVSSDVCRALETAKLMAVAPVEINEDLHRAPKRQDHRIHEARLKLIGTLPPSGTNTLLAGHMQHGDKPEHRLYLDMGEIVVFKPRGDGQADVVARIRQEDWPALLEFKTDPAGTHPAKP